MQHALEDVSKVRKVATGLGHLQCVAAETRRGKEREGRGGEGRRGDGGEGGEGGEERGWEREEGREGGEGGREGRRGEGEIIQYIGILTFVMHRCHATDSCQHNTGVTCHRELSAQTQVTCHRQLSA